MAGVKVEDCRNKGDRCSIFFSFVFIVIFVIVLFWRKKVYVWVCLGRIRLERNGDLVIK